MIKRYCDICGKEIIKNYPMCILSETTDFRGRKKRIYKEFHTPTSEETDLCGHCQTDVYNLINGLKTAIDSGNEDEVTITIKRDVRRGR